MSVLMYLCMYACMYVCMYVYLHARTKFATRVSQDPRECVEASVSGLAGEGSVIGPAASCRADRLGAGRE